MRDPANVGVRDEFRLNTFPPTNWFPIQVKQKDRAGRPDIDSFEAVMMREECDHGFFVSFDFTADAYAEIGAFFKRTGKTIKAFTVNDILDETKLGMKLARNVNLMLIVHGVPNIRRSAVLSLPPAGG